MAIRCCAYAGNPAAVCCGAALVGAALVAAALAAAIFSAAAARVGAARVGVLAIMLLPSVWGQSLDKEYRRHSCRYIPVRPCGPV